MPKRTIPEITEELRAHINSDNDAPRLIAEHVLPLLADTMAQSKLSIDGRKFLKKSVAKLEIELDRRIPRA